MDGYRPKDRGLGIVNWLKDRTGMNPTTWPVVAKVFAAYPTLARLSRYPVVGPMFKWAMMFSPWEKRFTQGVSLPLNVDVSDRAESVALPIDLMKDVVRRASYRLALNRCLCRDGHDCKTYPHDLACLFLGEAARETAKHGLGREVTADEACAIIDRAADLGLVGQALWIEVEQFVWGWHSEKMENFLEICFCCDCCCTALGVMRNSTRDVKRRFKSAGWQAEVDPEGCRLCRKCAPVCPQKAIAFDAGSARISPDCYGCGLCARQCAPGAIRIVPKAPAMARVEDYFTGLNLKL